MCTVTYIPTSDNNFIFTSNRDEAPKRTATGLISDAILGKQLIYPQDPKAQGTWICISDSNQLVCILNGAFVRHKRNLPYRMSRGKMALQFFQYKNAIEFFGLFDFQGMESFTMIIYDRDQLFELKWDEDKKHIRKLDTLQSHIWASCTLYEPKWIDKREQWFDKWQEEKKELTQGAVLDFHKNGGEGNAEFDLVMNRFDMVRTTSITSILKTERTIQLRYEDLLDQRILKEQVILSPTT